MVPVTLDQARRYSWLLYGPTIQKWGGHGEALLDCPNEDCKLRVRLPRSTQQPSSTTVLYDFTIPRKQAPLPTMHPQCIGPRTSFHTGRYCCQFVKDPTLLPKLPPVANQYTRGLDPVIIERLKVLLTAHETLGDAGTLNKGIEQIVILIGRGKKASLLALDARRNAVAQHLRGFETDYDSGISDAIKSALESTESSRHLKTQIKDCMYNLRMKDMGVPLTTSEQVEQAMQERFLVIPDDLVGRFFENDEELRLALGLTHLDPRHGFTVKLTANDLATFHEIAKQRRGRSWSSKELEEVPKFCMFLGIKQLLALQGVARQKVPFCYIDGTHGLDSNKAKWVIAFASTNAPDPKHGGQYRTSGIPLSFSRGAESLVVAVLTFLVLKSLAKKIFNVDLELRFVGSDRANAFVTAARLVFPGSISLQCYFHITQQVQPGHGSYLMMQLDEFPYFDKTARNDIRYLEQCTNEAMVPVLFGILVGWVHVYRQPKFARHFLGMYGQVLQMKFNYSATGTPGIYPSGNFAERANGLLKGTRATQGVVQLNASDRVHFQKNGSIDKATEWANQLYKTTVGIQFSESEDHTDISNVMIALMMDAGDCIPVGPDRWYANTPSRIGHQMNLDLFEKAIKGDLSAFGDTVERAVVANKNHYNQSYYDSSGQRGSPSQDASCQSKEPDENQDPSFDPSSKKRKQQTTCKDMGRQSNQNKSSPQTTLDSLSKILWDVVMSMYLSLYESPRACTC